MPNTLPTPTTNLTTAKSNLDEFGYYLIANAMTPSEVTAARTRLKEQIEAEKQLGVEYRDSGPDDKGVNQRLWHSTGANISNDSRWGILSYLCAPQFRQQENMMVGTSPEVLAQASPELLSLLGFKLWQGYGRIEAPRSDFITPDQKALGELRPK